MRRPTISTTAKEQLTKLFDLLVEGYQEAPTPAHALASTAAWSEMLGAWILGATVIPDSQESYEEPAQRTVRFYDGPRHGEDEAYPTPLPATIKVEVLPNEGEAFSVTPIFYDFELDTGGVVIYRHRPDDGASAAAPGEGR